MRGIGEAGRHHGLSHLSVDLKSLPFDKKFAHAQVYFNSPAVIDGITARLGALAIKPVKGLVNLANHFLIAGQGYLHSDFCHRLRFECDAAGVINVSVEHNADNARAVDQALSLFTREMRRFGAIFIKAAAKVISHGASKTAGAMPHSSSPDTAATDALGRPYGARNVFIVDGAVLPSISARNHTLTMMANSLRIGQLA